MKLSVIIPIYNVEPYLRKCVFSLIHQDFRDYEIILVDDGSTDESGKICDGLCETISDERLAIRVIHQENGGLSAARNAGLKVANGEYICFVDSDDYWEPNVLGGLMAQIERDNLDVLRFDYQNVNEQYEVFQPYKTPRYIDEKNDVVDGLTYLNTRIGYTCYAVMYIMRREIVPLFTEGIHFEDVDWLPRMMLQTKRVNSTSKIVYNYLIRHGSITQTQGNTYKIRENVEDEMTVIERYNSFISQYPTCKWLRNMQSSLVSGVLTTVAREFFTERQDYINRLHAMDVFPLSIADQGKTYKRRALLTNLFGAELYCRLMNVVR